ncbi:MAG: tail fiber domain-containing protein [Leptolyngbya sp. SIO4C1]|nr:tail fiber domain-containing protein [Leptolyngbya sp. SIO4C1]
MPSALTNSSQTMRSISRNELKSYFQNNTRLSEADFVRLIDATLNKRDDKFHGLWRPGRTYCPGDVVLYDESLWILGGTGEICSNRNNPPSRDGEDWKSLIIPVDDDDWEVLKDEGVMWAKVYEKIGIGIGSFEQEERPEAQLDVRKAELGRWLLFPEAAEQTLFTLLHYASTVERSYLTTGLLLDEVTWLSDAAKGYAFRKGLALTEEAEVLELAPTDGQILMVIKPKRIAGGGELATLGLNVEDPTAMVDITDGTRGQLLFTPEEKQDPALTIVNLDPECYNNYLAIGVGKYGSAFVSDAPDGFHFLLGGEYGEYCHEKNVNQGDFLALIRQHPNYSKAQMGIGADNPKARLDVKDEAAAQVLILPEPPVIEALEEGETETEAPMGEAVPAIALLSLAPNNLANSTYLTTGIGETVAGWVTNADRGFVFRQGGTAFIDYNHQNLVQGDTYLAIREDGRIGIGTEDPYARLEIVNQNASGKFLFNLDKKVNPALGILNLRPGSRENYFTIGADNNHAILVTDSQYGFLFKAGNEFGTNDSQIDVNQGDVLVSIRPEGTGQMGIGKQPIDYELDINGMTCTFTLYQDTDVSRMTKVGELEDTLELLQLLHPVTFEWNNASGFRDNGEQIGFLSHEVDDVFPQVVKTASDGTKAVAYQNLVPVVVQALKDLIAARNETQEQLTALQEEYRVYRQQMEERLTELSDRLRHCEEHL